LSQLWTAARQLQRDCTAGRPPALPRRTAPRRDPRPHVAGGSKPGAAPRSARSAAGRRKVQAAKPRPRVASLTVEWHCGPFRAVDASHPNVERAGEHGCRPANGTTGVRVALRASDEWRCGPAGGDAGRWGGSASRGAEVLALAAEVLAVGAEMRDGEETMRAIEVSCRPSALASRQGTWHGPRRGSLLLWRAPSWIALEERAVLLDSSRHVHEAA
jgi:hypothetical protein